MVKAADNIKYVSMLLDTSLSMKKQVATVHSKVSRNVALIWYNRKYLSLESCQELTLGLIRAVIEYGNALYFGLPNKALGKLHIP